MKTGDVTALSLFNSAVSGFRPQSPRDCVHVLLCIDVYVHTVTYSVQYICMLVHLMSAQAPSRVN